MSLNDKSASDGEYGITEEDIEEMRRRSKENEEGYYLTSEFEELPGYSIIDVGLKDTMIQIEFEDTSVLYTSKPDRLQASDFLESYLELNKKGLTNSRAATKARKEVYNSPETRMTQLVNSLSGEDTEEVETDLSKLANLLDVEN